MKKNGVIFFGGLVFGFLISFLFLKDSFETELLDYLSKSFPDSKWNKFENISGEDRKGFFSISNVEVVSFEEGKVSESLGGKFISSEEGARYTKNFSGKVKPDKFYPKFLLWNRESVGWKVKASLLDSLINFSGYEIDTILIELGKRKYDASLSESDKSRLSNTLVLSGLTSEQVSGQEVEKNGTWRVKQAKENSVMHQARNRTGDFSSGTVPKPAHAVIEYVGPCNTCP